MNRKNLMIVTAIAIILPLLCQAQPRPDRPMMQKHRRAEIESKMRTMKIWKLTEELDLTEEQAARFFPVMNEMEDKQREIDRERDEILEKLGELVWKQDPEAGEINRLLDQLEASQGKIAELRKQFRKDVSGILDSAQMGKLVLFNHHFPEVMRGLIRELEGQGPPQSPGNRQQNGP